MNKPTWRGQDHSEFYAPRYEIGDRIPGTKGKVVSKTYSYQGKWVYCIAFDNGFSTITFLTIAEDDIDVSVIKVLKQQK